MKQAQLEQPVVKPALFHIKQIARIAIFIALSAVGALIKIPSPVGTVGLDAAPGFFAVLAFGYFEGMTVIGVGHLLTAAVVGFPLTIPVHLAIAVQMALWAASFRWVDRKWGLIPAAVAATFLNGVVSSFTMLPISGIGSVLGVMPFLALGSVLNVVLAAVAYQAIKGSKLI